jgi:hypothetical protein
LVFKQQLASDYAENEYEALLYIRDEMIAGRLPPNYVFLYGSYTTTKVLPNRSTKLFKNFILEYVDKSLDDFLLDNDITELEYYKLFYKVAEAVDALERVKMNHGDLWGENIMLAFEFPDDYDQDDPEQTVFESDLPYTIKFIDFDAAYKRGSKVINKPALGGSDNTRNDFYLGYDMNRLLESVLYHHNATQKKIAKYRKSKQYVFAGEESISEIYENSIRYPEGFIQWIKTLGVIEPTRSHRQRPNFAGAEIMKRLKAKIDQFDSI